MIRNPVREYLDTQGLKLPIEDIEMAVIAAQTVLRVAQAEIDTSVLWYYENHFSLAEKLGVNLDSTANHTVTDLFTANNNSIQTLRQLYLAIDSWRSRYQNQSVALYLSEKNATSNYLVRLVSQGCVLPAYIQCDEAQMQQYLFVRTARTGWLNLIDDVDQWLKDGSLSGRQPGLSQLSLPITNEYVQVFGVIFATHERIKSFSEAELINWIGMALAIVPLVINLQSAMMATTKGHNCDPDTTS